MLKRFISSAVHLQKVFNMHTNIYSNRVSQYIQQYFAIQVLKLYLSLPNFSVVKFVNNNTFPRFFSKTTFVYNDTQKQPEQQTEKTKETKSETVRPIRYRGTVNRATIVGYVGQDPVQKEVKNDKTATWFSVATTEVVKGNRFTTWHNVVLFDKKAQQAVMDHVKQG